MKLMAKTTKAFLPYGRQNISQHNVDALVEVLVSDWLTQGPTMVVLNHFFDQDVGALFGSRPTQGSPIPGLAPTDIGTP
jgi:hypothetical protein